MSDADRADFLERDIASLEEYRGRTLAAIEGCIAAAARLRERLAGIDVKIAERAAELSAMNTQKDPAG
jgi:hypothetical protein